MDKTRYQISQDGGVFNVTIRNNIVRRARQGRTDDEKFKILTGVDSNRLPREPINNLSVFGIVRGYLDDMIELTSQMPTYKFTAISSKWNKIHDYYINLPPINYRYDKSIFVNNDTVYPTLERINRYRFCGIDTESCNNEMEMIQICLYNNYSENDYVIYIVRKQYFTNPNFNTFYRQLMTQSRTIKVYCDALHDILWNIIPNKMIDVMEREDITKDKQSLAKITANRLRMNMNVFTTPYMSPTFSDWSIENLNMVQKWYAVIDSLVVCMIAERTNANIETFKAYESRYNREELERNRIRGRLRKR